MPFWKTIKGTRFPMPYAAQRIEQRLCLDLYRIWVKGEKPGDEAWRTRAWGSAINHPWGGSCNYTNLALGVQASRGTDRQHRWHRHKYDCENKGHNLAEWCSINYNDRTVLGRACAVAGLQDPDHPAAELLRRDLLLFAILARPIVCRDNKGRVLYEGYGWRRAGLRSTANHWDTWLDSYLMARILDLDATVTKHGRKQEGEWCELVEAVATRLELGDCLYWLGLDLYEIAVGDAYGLTRVTSDFAPLRTPPGMSAILARDTVTGDTFSCLLGTRVGYNTAATWAVHAKGPELSDCSHCYAFRDRNGAPIDRVRTGKLRKAGKIGAYPDRVIRDASFPTGEVFTVSVRSEFGGLRDDIQTPPWLYDDSRAIRLEVYHDRDAVLALPQERLPGGG